MRRCVPVDPPRRIAIFRTDYLGDVILATPLFEAIKRRWPESWVAAVVRAAVKDVLIGHPFLDAVIEWPEQGAVEVLRQVRLDTAVIVYPRPAVAWACRRAGIPRRMGTAYRWYSGLFTHRMPVHRNTSGRHELELNFELIQPLEVSYRQEIPRVAVSDQDRGTALETLKQRGLSDRVQIVVVHPGSRGSAGNWSPEQYGTCIAVLSGEGIKVVVTGGPEDQETVNRCLAALPRDSVVNLCGRTTLRQLAALLSEASALVSGSTGPMHVAAAVGTPTVSLFPHDRAMSPTRWGPRGNRAEILQPERPDLSVTSISVDRVLAALLKILSEKKPRVEKNNQAQ